MKVLLLIFTCFATFSFSQVDNVYSARNKKVVSIKSYGRTKYEMRNAYPSNTIAISGCQLIAQEKVPNSSLMLFTFYTGDVKIDTVCYPGMFYNVFEYIPTENEIVSQLNLISDFDKRFDLILRPANFILFDKFAIYLKNFSYRLSSGRTIGGKYFPCYFFEYIKEK